MNKKEMADKLILLANKMPNDVHFGLRNEIQLCLYCDNDHLLEEISDGDYRDMYIAALEYAIDSILMAILSGNNFVKNTQKEIN